MRMLTTYEPIMGRLKSVMCPISMYVVGHGHRMALTRKATHMPAGRKTRRRLGLAVPLMANIKTTKNGNEHTTARISSVA